MLYSYMEYTYFVQILQNYKKFWEDISSLHDIGFDLMEGKYDLALPLEAIFKASIKSHYGTAGWEWVSWFAFESEFGEKDFSKTPNLVKQEDGKYKSVEKTSKFGAHDEDGNPICYSFESLWEYLEKNHKQQK